MTKLAATAYPLNFHYSQPTIRSNARPVSAKRLNGVRLNWFIIGALFGIILSFLLNIGVKHALDVATNKLLTSETTVASLLAPADESDLPPVPVIDPLDAFNDIPFPIESAELSEETAQEIETAKAHRPTAPKMIQHTMKRGDALLNLLTSQAIDYQEAHQVIQTLKKTYNPRNLRPGHDISMTVAPSDENPDRMVLADLAIELNAIDRVELTRSEDGFVAKKTQKPLSKELTLAGGTITNSLFETGYDNGIPDGVLAELVQAYSYDVDFQREIQRGDQMEVLFEKQVTNEGEAVGYGDILYATLKLRGKPLNIYRYQDSYYDENGESIIKALLKTPVNGARISSGYGKRRHPILGYTKMHKGTDFAAPTGTPIYAAGEGTVVFKGRKGGYGNYIKIKHNDTYSTAYAHMHRYGKGIRKGHKVKQGQIIGYVGSTGRSTGPHLHYEVIKHGRQVNPMKEKFKTGKVLKGKELAAFKKSMTKIKQQVASMPRSQTTVASSQ